MRFLLQSVAWAVVGVIAVPAAASVAHAQSADEQVRSAITAAVRAKLGGTLEVRIDTLTARGDLARPFAAQLPPGARAGSPVRFLLVGTDAAGTRVGEADATIAVSGRHLRAARALRRGETIPSDAVVVDDGDLGPVSLQMVPTSLTTGTAALRDIAAGELLAASSIRLPALVKSGDHVIVRVSVGTVSVQALMVAAQAGALGDVIRCVNPETRKATAARVVAPGLAEVVHAF